MKTLTLGDTILRLLPDAVLSVSGDSVFAYASRDEWSSMTPCDDGGNLRLEVRPLLITGPDGITLVDTGFGEERPDSEDPPRTGGIVEVFEGIGSSPADVSRVIITHTHGDHCLGNTVKRKGKWEPVFPHAEYIIQKREAAYLMTADRRMWAERFAPLEERGMLRLVDGDRTLTGSISVRLTPGHTIGHQIVVVSTPQGNAAYLGDLALFRLNLSRPEWGADWAWSRAEDAANRKTVIAWAAETGAVLILGHDPVNSFVRVGHEDGRYRYETLEDQE